jgi:hemerythrin-like domain-containing protein
MQYAAASQPAMTTPLPLHPAPGATFDEPFEMLAACHERVERMLRLMERLAGHLHDQGCDRNARQAAQDVMRYFDLAGPAHHEDEERHVFPLLLARGSPEVQAVVRRLQRDHHAMAHEWAAVRADLCKVAEGSWTRARAMEEAQRWQAYAALYRSHVEAEESLAYPAAQALLDQRAQQAMGREMALRRGVGVGSAEGVRLRP